MNSLQEQARIALDAKGSAERELAGVPMCPPWRHAIFGLIMGALVASPAVPIPLRFALIAGIFSAIALVVRSDRRRLGMFINGYRRGKTLFVTIPMLIIVLALYAIGLVRALDHGDRITPLMLGILAVVLGTAGSVLWQRVFVRELGA